MQSSQHHSNIHIMGVPFSCCSFNDILAEMAASIGKKRNGRYISITNTESTYHALRIPAHYRYIKNADFSCCDGIGVVMATKLFQLTVPRLHGPDLMVECCRYGADRQWRHYFYGGKAGVPEMLSKKFEHKHPGFITAGSYSPPFRKLTVEEENEVIDRINAARPDILWVGLGLLKQEEWIARHLGKIRVPWMVGVGAAFDFYAGTVKRAPEIFRRVGLEWLYRVAFEPRMIKRNLLSLKLFFMIVDDFRKSRNVV